MMSEKQIDIDLMPVLNAMMDALCKERDPVRQQQMIELMVVQHCMRCGSRHALMVAEAVHKHVKQFIKQVGDGWKEWEEK